jgi:hypothetical protein
MELAQDLKAVHGLDAETELSNILSAEILAEINREVVRTIYGTAVTGAQIGTTTAGTGTYSTNSQIGRYTKIGNRVYFNIYLVWTAHTGTGNMRVGGLPFTSNSTTNAFNAVSTWNANIAMTASNLLTAYVNVNANTVELRQYPTGGGADAAIPIDTAGSLMVAGHYEV